MTKKQLSIITTLTIVAIVFGLLISQRLWFRLDLTSSHAYTISEVSRKLYTEIPGQVLITYYLSEKLSAIDPMPREIEDLLREYAAYSRGSIRLSVKDPAKARLEETVERIGIRPNQIRTDEQDQTSFALVYSGITIEYLDKIEVLPWVFSLENLEYDLTSRIRTLTREGTQELGAIVADSFRQWDTDYQVLSQQFAQSGFHFRPIQPGEEIPEDLAGLFVLGGTEDLDEWDLYRIDRYIQTGGSVFFALDTVLVNTQGTWETKVLEDKGLLTMLGTYGAEVKQALVLDKTALTLRYQEATSFGIPLVREYRYPFWIGVLRENQGPDHPLTRGFGGIELFWASPLELHPQEPVIADPLFFSTGEAWLMTRDFNVNPSAPAYLREQEAPDTRGRKVLAAALSGRFRSFFAGQPKPMREGEPDLPDLPAEAQDARIVVIGDTDLAGAQFMHQADLDFLIKTALWLVHEDDIISIRSRDNQGGRLDKIVNEATRLRAMNFARILNVFVAPIVVIAAGVFLAWKRRTRVKALSFDK